MPIPLILRRRARCSVPARRSGSLARAGHAVWAATTAATLAALLSACATAPPGAPALPGAPGSPLTESPGPGWQRLHPAVHQRLATPVPDSRVHVLRIDLQAPGVRLRVSPPGERGQTLAEMASGRGALLSINASFYDRSFNPLGLTASGGERWSGVMQPDRAPLIGCTPQAVCAMELAERVRDNPAWSEVLGGRPWLVRAGRVRSAEDDAQCASLCAHTHPRTAVGLDASRRWLFLVLAEGRRPPVAGLTLVQLSAFMRELGVHDGLNLDGGGSSTLLVRGQSVMARPANEPALRRVANALHVFVDTPP